VTIPDSFEWTRVPGVGPGLKVLGDLRGRTVVEVGCGSGHNLAHLVAYRGAKGIGIDRDPAKVERAMKLYGDLPGISFVTADAAHELSALPAKSIDVCLSIFGAVSFSDPGPILSAAARALKPAGLLALTLRADDRRDAVLILSRKVAVELLPRIHLICDVDGVLIPFPAADGTIPSTHAEHWAAFPGEDEPVRIWLNPQHGTALADLVERIGASPAWCTTWRAAAAEQIGRRLGLPIWPTVALPTPPTDSSHQAGHIWKHPHVVVHAGPDPLIWIDDDFTDLDHAWAQDRAAAGFPTLLVEPDPHIGLQAEHLELILTFVGGLTLPARPAEVQGEPVPLPRSLVRALPLRE
jgi:SAM-dependent methyltransferase